MSCRSMVWKGLSFAEESCVPVTKGTFWPTMISASWLSIVTRVGVERMLLSESEAIAESSTPKSMPPEPKRPSASESPLASPEVPSLSASAAMSWVAPPRLV